jgi:hypothetical protein
MISTGATIVNCSLVNERYELVNKPIVVQLGPLDDNDFAAD